MEKERRLQAVSIQIFTDLEVAQLEYGKNHFAGLVMPDIHINCKHIDWEFLKDVDESGVYPDFDEWLESYGEYSPEVGRIKNYVFWRDYKQRVDKVLRMKIGKAKRDDGNKKLYIEEAIITLEVIAEGRAMGYTVILAERWKRCQKRLKGKIDQQTLNANVAKLVKPYKTNDADKRVELARAGIEALKKDLP